jgi:hypothetical protein
MDFFTEFGMTMSEKAYIQGNTKVGIHWSSKAAVILT